MKETLERTKISTPVIESLLWTDLYKLTMGQAVWKNFPEVEARYQFIDRGNRRFPDGFADKLVEQIEMMSELKLSDSDKGYLGSLGYLGKDYIDWFSKFRFNPDQVEVEQHDGELKVDIEGPWKDAIYWEVPLMTTISQLYFEDTGQKPNSDYVETAKEKGQFLRDQNAQFLEFGTRRAFSTDVHRNVLGGLIESAGLVKDGGVLLGTSNVALAKEFGIPVSGTYAHEWVMGMAAMYGVENANSKAMEFWAKEYLGTCEKPAYPKLGTALIDTYTTDVFLRSFKKEQAELFTNLRQDSGDALAVAEKIIRHLISIGVHPKDKGIVFSDGLDMRRIAQINAFLENRTNAVFGVGTNFTNDVGADPLNIVIKLFGIGEPGKLWTPTVKVSDDLSKASGDERAVEEVFNSLGLENPKKLHLVGVNMTRKGV
jgi:nicotinate phosphoribosyltransferase